MEVVDLTIENVIDLTSMEEDVIDLTVNEVTDVTDVVDLTGNDVNDGNEVELSEDLDSIEDRPSHATCLICLRQITSRDEGGNMTLLQCGHTFHNFCMNKWIVVRQECPTCRGTLENAQNM